MSLSSGSYIASATNYNMIPKLGIIAALMVGVAWAGKKVTWGEEVPNDIYDKCAKQVWPEGEPPKDADDNVRCPSGPGACVRDQTDGSIKLWYATPCYPYEFFKCFRTAENKEVPEKLDMNVCIHFRGNDKVNPAVSTGTTAPGEDDGTDSPSEGPTTAAGTTAPNESTETTTASNDETTAADAESTKKP